MTQFELEQGLNALRKDLFAADSMDEATACRVYNVEYLHFLYTLFLSYNTSLSHTIINHFNLFCIKFLNRSFVEPLKKTDAFVIVR